MWCTAHSVRTRCLLIRQTGILPPVPLITDGPDGRERLYTASRKIDRSLLSVCVQWTRVSGLQRETRDVGCRPASSRTRERDRERPKG
jgi:hypothetical protein